MDSIYLRERFLHKAKLSLIEHCLVFLQLVNLFLRVSAYGLINRPLVVGVFVSPTLNMSFVAGKSSNLKTRLV